MGSPIDRTAKTALDANLVNGNVSDAPKIANNNDVLYDYVDGLNSGQDSHATNATLAHPDGSVTTAKIRDANVTNPKYAPLSVTGDKVANATLDATKFVPGALTNDTQNALRITKIESKTAFFVTLEQYTNGTDPAYWDGIINDILTQAHDSNISFEIHFQPKEYKFQNTISITSKYMRFVGSSVGYTKFSFINSVPNKEFIGLYNRSSGNSFENITFYDSTPNTSIGVKLIDDTADGEPNWYNNFKYCRWFDFKIGANFTTTNPLSGSTHGYLDSTNFEHCKFRNCRISFLNQNIQSVNINLFGTDVENDDVSETYTMIRDEAGSSMNIFGGSWIGRGKIFEIYRATAGTNLFTGARYSFYATRFEVRATQVGVMVDMVVDGNTNYFNQISLQIDFDRCSFFGFNQVLRFNHTVRSNININKCSVLGGVIVIYDTPTQNVNATVTGGGASVITITDSSGFSFKEDTSSNFGTFNRSFSSIISVENKMASLNNATMGQDSQGFFQPNGAQNKYTQLGYGINVTHNKVLFNESNIGGGFQSIKMRLPTHARPLKAFAFKHPINMSNIIFDVYMVKDNSFWVNPSSFDYTTDAIFITTLDTTGKAGYFESEYQVSTNAMGAYLQVDNIGGTPSWNWQEGRIYFRHYNAPENFRGFVGIEFI